MPTPGALLLPVSGFLVYEVALQLSALLTLSLGLRAAVKKCLAARTAAKLLVWCLGGRIEHLPATGSRAIPEPENLRRLAVAADGDREDILCPEPFPTLSFNVRVCGHPVRELGARREAVFLQELINFALQVFEFAL